MPDWRLAMGLAGMRLRPMTVPGSAMATTGALMAWIRYGVLRLVRLMGQGHR